MLLPPGFYDVLAPEAARLAEASEALLKSFASFGYARIAAPLMEFEETLLAGAGTALGRATFRVMDTVSQRMLGIRTDHTLQIGRIAASRLHDAPRPLRLSYAGPVVRLQPGESAEARQFTQVGLELIGSLAPESDAEAITLALYGLRQLGITDITVDLLLPTLIPALCDAEGMDAHTRATLHHALDRKDDAGVKTLKEKTGSKAAAQALELLRSSHNAREALALLERMDLPEKALADRARLARVVALLQADNPPPLTVDLVEYRGFEYQTGLSFTIFSRRTRAELARGGRYRTATQEPATGFTVYAEALLPELTPPPGVKVREVPFGLSLAEKEKLIATGFILKQV